MGTRDDPNSSTLGDAACRIIAKLDRLEACISPLEVTVERIAARAERDRRITRFRVTSPSLLSVVLMGTPAVDIAVPGREDDLFTADHGEFLPVEDVTVWRI